MAMQPLRFGLIGAGGISQSYAQAFERSELAQVAAVVEVRPDAARALAERMGCAGASFTSHVEMLDHVGPRRVIDRIRSEGSELPTMLRVLSEHGGDSFYRNGEFLGVDGAWHPVPG